jgi:membrane associated rhomboid family serine protease
MPLIPIGTEFRPRHAPVANYVLIGLNILVFLFTDYFGGVVGAQLKTFYALDAARPSIAQYVTYQFLHGDMWHLLGNMLFLWIFGNPVCDRMGAVGYVLFYLAGGIFAGVAFALTADSPLIGASGAIAAVTTAFLALFPRVHITMLWWFFFFFTFQVPALLLIVFKIILWDTIVAPQLEGAPGAANVAYSAHMGGYLFGFAVALGLLAVRALPRNQFDLIALWDRWRRRSGLVGVGAGGPLVARPIVVEEVESHPLETVPLTPVEQLREEIAAHLSAHDAAAAAAAYLRLMELDEHQVLARPQQVEIANYLAHIREYQPAAAAYEAYLTAYPGAADAPQVRLLLGLICSRYLHDYGRAVVHLRQAREALQADPQRALADEELRHAEEQLKEGTAAD